MNKVSNLMDARQPGDMPSPLEFREAFDADQAAQASPAEIAENRRRCWKPGCNRTSRLEWCGWKYCLRHYWTNIIRDAGWPHALTKLRWTRFVRR